MRHTESAPTASSGRRYLCTVPSVSSPTRFRARGRFLEGERGSQLNDPLRLPVHSSTSKATADGLCTYLVKQCGWGGVRLDDGVPCATWTSMQSQTVFALNTGSYPAASRGFCQIHLMTTSNGSGDFSEVSYSRGEDEAEWPRVRQQSEHVRFH